MGSSAVPRSLDPAARELLRIVAWPVRGAVSRSLARRARRRSVADQSERMAALLEENRERLAPGRWRQTGRIAHLDGAPLTPHLEATVLARELDGRTIARRSHDVGGAGSCTVLIESGDEGEIVLFDPTVPAYIRRRTPRSFDTEYVALRRRFQQHVPGPDFRVREDGAELVEPLLDGLTLASLGPEQQVTAGRRLLEQLCTLVSSDVEELPETRSAVLQRIHAALRDALASADGIDADTGLLAALLEVRSGAPAKGPALGQNNLVVLDGVLHCIDFARMAVLPRWSDPSTLVVHTLPQMLRTERFAQEVTRLLLAAGVEHEYRGTRAERAALVLATITTERLKVHRSDPALEAEKRGIEAVVDRSIGELRREWPGLVA